MSDKVIELLQVKDLSLISLHDITAQASTITYVTLEIIERPSLLNDAFRLEIALIKLLLQWTTYH